VSYVERRRGVDPDRAPQVLNEVEISLAGKSVPLRIVASRANGRQEIDSVATGRVALDLLKTFADARNRSLTVATTSDDVSTAIRIGNAGLARSFPQLLTACAGPVRQRNARNELRSGG